ncbi:probable alpha-ketoglutarate-dependent hypophosphite dioxygenase [Watersipora subatra]|uniref:probable alpha-ketoglutarate-dependent hypophosphite dioxygenase n=1 Tax=Watersipora subatra TaxID=2589382 RepID=UPI00355B4443
METCKDLAKVHHPITNIFQLEGGDDEYKLSEELVEEFWKKGFIANIPILTDVQCDLLLRDCHALQELEAEDPRMSLMYEYHKNQSGDDSNVLFHTLGQWRVFETFHDIIFNRKITVPSSQLLTEGKRRSVRWWHDQLFAKPAHHGGVVAWHQDYSYWTRTQPMAHLTVHIALDDQTLTNGALHYIPESHKWTRNGGKPLPVTDFDFKDMESIKTIFSEDELAGFHPIPVLLKKGEASFHHPLSVHGSYGNRSEHPRRATVLNFFADGVKSAIDGDLIGGAHVPKGSVMEGDFFPLVYRSLEKQ